jgi:hypothetical protein
MRVAMDVDVQIRLEALAAALGAPAAVSAASSDASRENVADLQRAVTANLDVLLQRVAGVTALLRKEEDGWDAVDQVAAKLILSDLAVVAGIARALGQLAESQLAWASSELRDAGREAERIIKAAKAFE